MVGVSYGDRFTVGPLRVAAGVRAMGTIQRAGVDYTAQLEWFGDLELPITPRVSVAGAAEWDIVPVDRQMLGRTTRHGGLAFGGVRFPTRAGAIDLYAGWERRIDAGQFSREAARWFRLGLRLRTPVR